MSAEPTQRVLELRFPARADQLHGVREAVRQRARAAGCSETCTGDIVLAVDEACQNIIRHAYCGDPEGSIVLEMERRDDELVVSLRDFAPEVDASRIRPRDLDDVRPGGLGTHFIRECMDRADFVPPPEGRGNLLRMVKRIE
jgi:sigma-B regulation protein RsbU (phosphoserine phosphatase)